MNNLSSKDVIYVRDIYLWAHVGVYEEERDLGQSFSLDFRVWMDLQISGKNDKLSSTADYSLGIKSIQNLSFNIKCFTIEHFSEQILDCLETIYGRIPIQIDLRKCYPPVSGFNGYVGIQRSRNFE
tara:strand:+ start:51 stop:428 length:378 start_codon:yes stop_codon:yes gene_type:complete